MVLTAREVAQKRKELWKRTHDMAEDRSFCELVSKYLVSDAGAELRAEVKESPWLLIEMFFHIVDKEMQTVPFFLNPVQQKLLDIMVKAIREKEARKRLKLYFMILKGRQQGITAFISAWQLCFVLTRVNFSGYTLADSGDNSESIFEEKGKFIKNRIPKELQPVEKFSSKRELRMERLNSVWRVATAGDKDVGRSKMLNFFHGSEAAFWKSIYTILGGLGSALTVKSCMVILESTANGSNDFKAEWDNPNSEFEKIFFVWWESAEYSLDFEDGEARTSYLKRVEDSRKDTWKDADDINWVLFRCKQLLHEFKLTEEQAYWYFRKWKEIRSLIRQEYPCTPEEAFLATGNSVYRNIDEICDRIEILRKRQEETPPKRGYFWVEWRDPEARDKILRFRWVDDSNGPIKIYESPVYGTPYVMAGDTKGAAAGIVQGRDSYAVSVKDNSTGKRVCTLHSTTMSPSDYAAQVFCLGRFYNNALVAIEINIDSYPQIKLQELGYNNLYVRKVYDTFTGDYKEAYGWRTDSNNRPLIISQHIVLMYDRIDLFNDVEMLKQCLTFVDNGRRYDHETGEHDDLLFCDMILEEVSKTYRKKTKEPEPVKEKRLLTQLKANKKGGRA